MSFWIVRLCVQTRSLCLKATPTVMRPLCASARRSLRAANLKNWLQPSRKKSASSCNFDHLYFVVLKENSKEIEYLLWGKGPIPLPDLPMEELPTWEAMRQPKPAAYS